MATVVKYKKIAEEGDGGNGYPLSGSEEEPSSSDREISLELLKGETPAKKEESKTRRWNGRIVCPKIGIMTIVLGLAVFCVALGISFIITRVLEEPKEEAPYYNAGVASDVPVCSRMGANILEQGGSAIDSAIVVMLCVGVVNPESSGIGGGGFMVVFDPVKQSTTAIDFRETAPYAAHVNMFNGSSTLSTIGGLSVGVPGELAGMKKAHDMFGRLPWKQLFDPVVNLSRNGFPMTEHNERSVRYRSDLFVNDTLFHSWYFNEDGSIKTAGDLIQRPELADTLEYIGTNGIDDFYNGSIAMEIVETVVSNGGILTLEDLMDYEPLVLDPVSITLDNNNNLQLLAPPLPSGGPQFLFIMGLLDMIAQDGRIEDDFQAQQHLVEAFKYSFAFRSNLGDPWCEECDRESLLQLQNNKLLTKEYLKFINSSISDYRTYNASHYNASYITEDHGTTHVSAVGPDGMAVSVTTSVNTYFGSKLITPVSGIVLNDDMDDFSSPNIINAFGLEPSEANFIKPGKRALSSTCPAIALEKGSDGKLFAKLMSGGAGGAHIITANAQAVMRVLYFNEDVASAIEARRLHHILLPNILYYERNYSEPVLDYLRSIGHVTSEDKAWAVIQQVLVDSVSRNVSAHSDQRKQGKSTITHIQ